MRLLLITGRTLLPLALAFLCAPAYVAACSCAPERPTCEAFGSAKAIFVGTVLGAKEQREYVADGVKRTFDVGEIYFKVEQAFHGINSKKVVIHSGTGGGDCGYWFVRGKQYLVYAYGNSIETLGTNICTRTRELSRAEEDLAFLKNLPRKGAGARMYGTVQAAHLDPKSDKWRIYKPLSGITVKIEGERRTLDAMTDDKGNYEIVGLAPGKYKVYPELPDYYRQNEYFVRKVEINDRGCAQEDFFAQNDSQIVGRVFRPDGTVMSKANVELIPAEGALTRRSIDETWANENGKYELREIAPGRYLLGINITSSPSKESPFPRTFYPGVTDRSQAGVIEIGRGQKLTNIDIRLTENLIERSVSGFVVYADGSLASNVDIHLEDVNRPGWCVNGCDYRTDSQGQFALKGYDGYTYRVMSLADANSPGNAQKANIYGESPTFTLSADKEGLKLTLSKPGRPWDKQ